VISSNAERALRAPNAVIWYKRRLGLPSKLGSPVSQRLSTHPACSRRIRIG
jgi:hypothetical protein